MKKIILVILLSLIVAAIIRFALPWGYTFVNGEIRFSQVDSYYSLLIVDSIFAGTFLNLEFFGSMPALNEYIVVGLTYLISLGNPTTLLAETIAAISTGIYGLIAIILVFFISKTLFNQTVALISTPIMAIMPGEILSRTSLGFFDHHSLELVLFLASILFFIYAIKHNSVTYSLISGIFAGLYLSNWIGGIFLLGIYIVYSFISIYLSKNNVHFRATSIVIATSIAVNAWMPWVRPHYIVLIFAIYTILLFVAILRSFLSNLSPLKVVLITIMPVVLIEVVNYLTLGIGNDIVSTVVGRLLWSNTIISEGCPLFLDNGQFTLSKVWGNFGFLFFIFLFGIGNLIYLYRKHEDNLFLLIWSVAVLFATLSGIRFSLYLSVNVVIISTYVMYQIFQKIKITRRALAYTVIVGIIIVSPLINYTTLMAKPSLEYYTDSWRSATSWIKDNTKATDNILSLWDNGYWIWREGNRKPMADPGRPDNNRKLVSNIMTSDSITGLELINANNVHYLVIDKLMVTSKYYSYAYYHEPELQRWQTLGYRLYFGYPMSGFTKVFDSEEVSIFKVN